MIIRYISNPLDPKKEKIELEVKYSYQSMADHFEQHFPEKDREFVIPTCTGKIVDWDYCPNKNDDIIYIVDVTGGKFLGAILGVVLIVASFYVPVGGTYMRMVGISMLAGVAMGFLMPGMSMPDMDDSFEDSATYHWSGINNWTKEGGPVPILYGEHRIGGPIIEAFVEKEGVHDEYLYMLIGLSEGPIEEIDTTTIEINNKSIDFYEDVDVYTKLGTSTQTPISQFSKIARYYKVTGVEFVYDTPYTYETFNECDAANITIKFPQLFSMSKKGKFQDKTCHFDVAYKRSSDSTWTDFTSQSVTARSKSEVNHTFKIIFPSVDTWDVKITRTSSAFTGSREAGRSYLGSVTEYETGAIAYENTALLGLVIKATNELSGNLPTVTVKCKGRTIEDVKTGSIAYSNNPANIINDILTNTRYGIGNYMTSDNIDEDKMIEYHDNNDEMVDYEEWNGSTGSYDTKSEKRYEVNLYIDKEFRAVDIINRIAAVSRMLPVWSGNKFKPIVDEDSPITQIFTMGNIVADSFEQTFIEPQKIPNQIKGSFLNEDDSYKRDYIPGVDKSRINESTISKTIDLFGLTKRSRVKREVIYALKSAKAVKQHIAFSTGLDAIVCEVGDIIGFSHKTPGYGHSGRLESKAGNVITLDQEVDFDSGTEYAIRIVHPDNSITRHTWTASTTETTNEIDIGTDAADCAEYDIYAVGELDIEVKPYRVMSMIKSSNYTCQITGSEYSSEVYNEDESIDVFPVNYSNLGLIENYEWDGGSGDPTAGDDYPTTGTPGDIPPYVTDVSLTESIEDTGSGYVSNIVVNFGKVNMQDNSVCYIERYDIMYSIDEHQSWMLAGSSQNGYFEIPNVTKNQEYYVIVKPYTNYGITNNIEATTYNDNWSITPAGWDEVPDPATGLTVVADLFINRLSWTNPSITDLKEVEIWAAFNTNNRTSATLVGVETKPSNHHSHYVNQTGTWYYWVRTIDFAGNEGDFEPLGSTDGVEANPNISNSVIIDGLEEAISESELTAALVSTIEDADNAPIFSIIDNQYTVKIQDGDYVTGFGLINHPDWSSSTTYSAGDCVIASDSKYYKCILGNTDHEPPNATYWLEIPDGVKSEFSILADRFSVINQNDNGDIISPFIVDATQGVVIDGVHVKDGTISADALDVNDLSAINADLGTITAGLMKSSDNEFKIDLDDKYIIIDDDARIRLDGTGMLQVGDKNIQISGTTNDIIVAENGGVDSNDYVRISPNHGIEIVYYMNGQHRNNKPLSRMEVGTCENDVPVNIPGYWKNPPKIILSIKSGTIYNSTYPDNDQYLQMEVANLEQYSYGQYRFTPRVRLIMDSVNFGEIVTESTLSDPYTEATWITTMHTMSSSNIQFKFENAIIKARNYRSMSTDYYDDGYEGGNSWTEYTMCYRKVDLEWKFALYESSTNTWPWISDIFTMDNYMGVGVNAEAEPFNLPTITTDILPAGVYTPYLYFRWTLKTGNENNFYRTFIGSYPSGIKTDVAYCAIGDLDVGPSAPTVISTDATLNFTAIGT